MTILEESNVWLERVDHVDSHATLLKAYLGGDNTRETRKKYNRHGKYLLALLHMNGPNGLKDTSRDAAKKTHKKTN